jgi:hypothetical protein
VHVDGNTSAFDACHPAVDLGLRDPAIRLRNLVTLHQEVIPIQATPPAQHTVNHDVIRSAAAQDYICDPNPASLHRLHQQAVTIAYQWLHAGAARPEAQGFAAL